VQNSQACLLGARRGRRNIYPLKSAGICGRIPTNGPQGRSEGCRRQTSIHASEYGPGIHRNRILLWSLEFVLMSTQLTRESIPCNNHTCYVQATRPLPSTCFLLTAERFLLSAHSQHDLLFNKQTCLQSRSVRGMRPWFLLNWIKIKPEISPNRISDTMKPRCWICCRSKASNGGTNYGQ
jgi:hypothetical protein